MLCHTLLDYGVRTSTRTNDFTMKGEQYIAKCVYILDGDGCRIVLRRRGELMQFNVRMSGYDSPELKPRLADPNRNAEIVAANAAKQFLSDMILGKMIRVKCDGFDKYGRLLCTMYKRKWVFARATKSINAIMIETGHGYVYNGGKKQKMNQITSDIV